MRVDPQAETIGEIYGPAMEITDPEEAREYFQSLVQRCMERAEEDGNEPDLEYCEYTQRSNLGYYAGYYDPIVRKRVEILFGAMHPIFGSANPTSEEAFEIGGAIAQRLYEESP